MICRSGAAHVIFVVRDQFGRYPSRVIVSGPDINNLHVGCGAFGDFLPRGDEAIVFRRGAASWIEIEVRGFLRKLNSFFRAFLGECLNGVKAAQFD